MSSVKSLLSVGIVGARGYMGAPFYAGLLKASQRGNLRLILLHRPSSDISGFSSEIEKRSVDLDNAPIDSIRQVVQDLNVVVSAVSGRAFATQYRLIEALAGSSNLVTFMPSEYATPMAKEDFTSPYLRHEVKQGIVDKAKELGVPHTVIKNATTDELLFGYPSFCSFHPKENRVELYTPFGNGKRGLTSKEFSGGALVHLLLNRLDDLPNNTFSFVELDFSAQDIIDVFTRLHNGTPPKIDEYTEEDYQRGLKESFFGAMRSARLKGLHRGANWPGEKIQTFEGWEGKSLEEYARKYLYNDRVKGSYW